MAQQEKLWEEEEEEGVSLGEVEWEWEGGWMDVDGRHVDQSIDLMQLDTFGGGEGRC